MPTMSARGTVLVIDDDDAVRSVLRRFLAAAGYEVQEAENGRVGLEIVEREKPDLIVLDLMMPEMTGYEVIATLRGHASWSGIPVVVLTSNQGHSARELQVDATLMKPFDMADVQASAQAGEAGSTRAKPPSNARRMRVTELM